MSRVALGAAGTQEGKGPWRVGCRKCESFVHGVMLCTEPALRARIWVSALDQAAGPEPLTMCSA